MDNNDLVFINIKKPNLNITKNNYKKILLVILFMILCTLISLFIIYYLYPDKWHSLFNYEESSNNGKEINNKEHNNNIKKNKK